MKEAVLLQKQSFKGVIYGPGKVELEDDVHAAFTRRGAFNHPMADYPALILAGYKTLEEARAMDDSVLLKIDGLGPATIRKLRGEPDEEPKPVKGPKFIGDKTDGTAKERA
jgi:hypothetical protein